MKKEYYKLKDINADILIYKKSLRWYPKGSNEYTQFEKELNRLIARKEKLKRENAGNPAFFHNGIPPHKPDSRNARKQRKINELYQERDLYLKKADEVEQSIKAVKKTDRKLF